MTEAEYLASADPSAMLDFLAGGNPLRAQCPAPPPSDRKLRLFACACCRLRGTPADVVEGYEANGPPVDDYEHAEDRHTDLMWARGWTERGSGNPSLATRAALLRDVVGNPFRPVCLPRGKAPCPDCEPGAADENCDDCGGDGWVYAPCPWLTPTVRALALAAYSERAGRACGRCGGRGVICRPGVPHPMVPFDSGIRHIIELPDDEPCPGCGGTGTVSDGTLDPGRLEILADALQDAGCDDAEILSHLRGRERHDCRAFCGTRHDSACLLANGSGWIPLRGPHVAGCWCVDLLLVKS